MISIAIENGLVKNVIVREILLRQIKLRHDETIRRMRERIFTVEDIELLYRIKPSFEY